MYALNTFVPNAGEGPKFHSSMICSNKSFLCRMAHWPRAAGATNLHSNYMSRAPLSSGLEEVLHTKWKG